MDIYFDEDIIMQTLHVKYKFPTENKPYEVTKAVNTTAYDIREALSKQQVQELCNKPNWKVIIT